MLPRLRTIYLAILLSFILAINVFIQPSHAWMNQENDGTIAAPGIEINLLTLHFDNNGTISFDKGFSSILFQSGLSVGLGIIGLLIGAILVELAFGPGSLTQSPSQIRLVRDLPHFFYILQIIGSIAGALIASSHYQIDLALGFTLLGSLLAEFITHLFLTTFLPIVNPGGIHEIIGYIVLVLLAPVGAVTGFNVGKQIKIFQPDSNSPQASCPLSLDTSCYEPKLIL